MTSSVLQLAHAYSIFAYDGKLCPISLTLEKQPPFCPSVISATHVNQVLQMLHSVVTIHGTGVLANIPGFEVDGKTGTTHKVSHGGFLKKVITRFLQELHP